MSDDECDPAEQAGGAAHADAPGRAVAQHLLDFQQSIVEELLENDGMTIMGQGMGVCTIAAALLAVHHLARASGGVVLILGAQALVLISSPTPLLWRECQAWFVLDHACCGF